ncbi:DUF5949 family protein [Streptomyces sp. NPDC050418]|uniref:DUF5949 family protein n=1 Tax=Streptomyces sp. NPDC050418 TaxID=3365612 RepID=UPI0037B31039
MVDASTLPAHALGTLSILTWIGAPEEGNTTPYLLAYPLGDGPQGAEGAQDAMVGLAQELSLTPGGGMTDGSAPSFPVKLLVESGQAVLTMGAFRAQCAVPPEWAAAVDAGEKVHLIVSPRAWPQAVPGEPVAPETLSAYIGDEAVFAQAAHCALPAGRLR